jgi:hypothetical protein
MCKACEALHLAARQIPLIKSLYRKCGKDGSIEPGTVTLKQIGEIVGIDLTSVSAVITGKAWRHIP